MRKKGYYLLVAMLLLVAVAAGAQAWRNYEGDNDVSVPAFEIDALYEAAELIPEEDVATDAMPEDTKDPEETREPEEEVTVENNESAATEKPQEKTQAAVTTPPAPRPDRVTADRSKAPATPSPAPEPQIQEPRPEQKPEQKPADASVTYTTYTVKQGDTFWLISQTVGIPMPELLKVNNMTENTSLYPGMTLSVPQYSIPVKETPGPQYGELVDWWTEAQYIWPIGQNAKVVDFRTGKSFTVRRSYGAFHADVEPLTAADTAAMREIWGNWSWATRPVIVEVNGRRLAASANGMPHSIQTITTNNFNGHFCIHFLNSTRHKDNVMQADHQQNARAAAGQ